MESCQDETERRSPHNNECRAEIAEADHPKSPLRSCDELLDKLLLSLAATWSIVQVVCRKKWFLSQPMQVDEMDGQTGTALSWVYPTP